MRDYNNELELILDKKLFTVDTKNILLSMMYKIDISYNDYSIVKRNVQEKRDFIEGLLNTIESCNKIDLIKPSVEDKEKNIYTIFNVDIKKKEIEVYPNEKTMLYALNELNYTKMSLNEDYVLIKDSIPYVINKGREINNTEIIRDFDAWSWNTQIDEIASVEANLLYQNLQMLFGYDKLEEVINTKSIKSDLSVLENSLTRLYGKEIATKFLKLLYKISIILLTNEDENEKLKILEQKEILEKEYIKYSNKEEFVENITKSKKQINKKIREIDIMLNNTDLLISEYEKRNEKLPEHSKIFSLSHFSEILVRERNKQIRKLEELNKKIEPKNYTKIKEKYEKDLKMLSGIELEENKKTSTERFMYSIQKEFLKALMVQIEKADNKKQLIYLTYILRYYNFLPFSKNKLIKDVKKLEEILSNVKEEIIKKMYEFKLVNKNINDIILKKIFDTKITALEGIQLELKKEKDKIVLYFYDEKTISDSFEMENFDLNLKYNKKYKLFV